MNLDNVIELTRALGICELTSKPKQDIHYSLTIDEMLSFANLVAEHEREACAQICDVLAVHPEYASDITKLAAQAIRKRK